MTSITSYTYKVELLFVEIAYFSSLISPYNLTAPLVVDCFFMFSLKSFFKGIKDQNSCNHFIVAI